MSTLVILFIFACFPSNLCIRHHFQWKSIFRTEPKDDSFIGTIHNKIFLGSKVNIPCIGKGESSKDASKFKWEHNNVLVSELPGYSVDNRGDLTINEVKLGDSGKFICTASVSEQLKKWEHEVTVVQLPSASLHIFFVYLLKTCSNITEDIAKNFIESRLNGKVCTKKECRVSFVHSSCHFEELTSPTLRVTVPLVVPETTTGSCNEDCTRKKLIELEEQVKKEVVDIVMKGEGLKIPGEEEMTISYFDSTQDMMCDPGFEIVEENITSPICVPCTPGHFFEKGRCIPCFLNQYSDRYGATECRFCEDDRMTRKRGGKSEDECKYASLTALWILLLIMLFPSIMCVTCCCWSLRYFAGEGSLSTCIDTCCYLILCDCQSLKNFRTRHQTNPSEEQLVTTISQPMKVEDPNLKKSPKGVFNVLTASDASQTRMHNFIQGQQIKSGRSDWKRKGRANEVLHVDVILPTSQQHPELKVVAKKTLTHFIDAEDKTDPDLRGKSFIERVTNTKNLHKYSPFNKRLAAKLKPLEELPHTPRKRTKIHSIYIPTKKCKKQGPLSCQERVPNEQGDMNAERDLNWRPCEHEECRLWTQPDAIEH